MKKFVYLFSLLFLLSGCVKMFEDEIADGLKNMFQTTSPYLDYMPEKTTSGNNVFGCYEDGKLLAVQGIKQMEGKDWGWFPVSRVNAMQYQREQGLVFVLIVPPQNDGYIYIKSLNIKQGINRCSIVHNHHLDLDHDIYFETTDSVDVDITYLDESKHIVCGEFEKVVLYNEKNNEETIILTNCQFDVMYGTDYFDSSQTSIK